MIESTSEPCADPERLAALAEGRLSPQWRAEVVRHVSRCAKCRLVVESAAAEVIEERRRSFTRRVSVAAAAGLAAILTGYLLVRESWPRRAEPLVELASEMPTSGRTIEPRFSGFGWAPLVRVRSGGDSKRTAEELTIIGHAGAALRDIGDGRSTPALHAAGVAYVLRNDAGRGVPKLKEAAARAPRDARIWSDLAAALYVDAAARDDETGFRDALDAADRAIRLNGRLGEAYFNRALIVERIGSRAEAEAAWKSFLGVEGASGWAAEARNHLPSP